MSARTRVQKRLRVLPVLALVLALAVMMLDPYGAATALRLKGFDFLQASAPAPSAETATRPPAIAVEIDEAALEAFGPWPWPRWRLAETVRRIAAAGPRLLVFDLVLAEPDPTSPENAVRAFAPGTEIGELEAALSGSPGHDRALSSALRSANAIAAFGAADRPPPGAAVPPPAEFGFVFPRDNPLTMVPDRASAVRSVPAMDVRADHLGAALQSPDADGKLRRLALLANVGGSLEPTLALQAMRALLDAEGAEVLAVRTGTNPYTGKRGEVVSLAMSGRLIPTAPDGGIWLAWPKDAALRRLSAAELAKPDFDLSQLSGRIVVLGKGPAAGGALWPTPPGESLTSAAATALGLERLEAGPLLKRTTATAGVELAAVVGAGILLALLGPSLPMLVTLLFTAGSLAGGLALARAGFIADGTLYDVAVAPLAILAVAAASLGLRLYAAHVGESELRAAFRAKIGPATLRATAREPSRGGFEGDRRKASVLIAGIRGFDDITESLIEDPEGVRILLTEFATWAEAHIRRSRGTFDRLDGPLAIAFWNAPGDDMDHALHACDCAMRMIEGLEALNRRLEIEAERRHRALPPIQVEVAVNTGQCFVGDFGSRERPDYGLVGDVMTAAHRMVRRSHRYGPAILVGEHTANAVRNLFALLEIDRLEIPQKQMPMRVYALLGNPLVRASPRFRTLETKHTEIFAALEARDWPKVRTLIAEARELRGAVPSLYDLYARRLDHLERDPPGEGWDGVVRSSVV